MISFIKTKLLRLETIVVILTSFIWSQGTYLLARVIASSWYHYDLSLPIDAEFPLVPWTVAIYFGAYLFWGITYCYMATVGKNDRDRYFCADAIAKTVAFAMFLLIPMRIARPEITGDGVWDSVMRFLYTIDTPDNLFPSIHCLASWMCFIGLRGRREVHIVIKVLSFVAAVAVCVSTLTTRQHVIVDVISGVLLAEISYFISRFEVVRNGYYFIIAAIMRLFEKKKK